VVSQKVGVENEQVSVMSSVGAAEPEKQAKEACPESINLKYLVLLVSLVCPRTRLEQ
jgi:hypothetical protein